jgi:hypothetical protein
VLILVGCVGEGIFPVELLFVDLRQMVWAHNVVTETFFQILHEYGVQSVQGDDAVGKVWCGCNLLNYVK